jgi:hypothetical protein
MKLGQLFNRLNILALTASMRPAAVPAEPPAKPTAAERKAGLIAAHLDKSDFGCQQENVRKLVEMLLGTTLPAPATPRGRSTSAASRIPMQVGALLKVGNKIGLIKSIDTDGDPRLINDDGNALTINGREYVPLATRNIAVPTDDEVTAWCDQAGLA